MQGLLITTDKNDYVPMRLQEEASRLSRQLDVVEYQDLAVVLTGKEMTMRVDDLPLEHYQSFYFRKPRNNKLDVISYDFLRCFAVNYLSVRTTNIRLLNGVYFKKYAMKHDKLNQTLELKKAGLPIIDTLYVGRVAKVRDLLVGQWPVVSKPIDRSLGQGVKSFEDENDWLSLVNENKQNDLMFNKKLPGLADYRILVLKGKVIGAIKRVAPEGQLVTNISAGGRGEKVTLSEELEALAIAAAQTFELDFAGVDVMNDADGVARVLEVNESPSFEGVEKTLGINIAQELINAVFA